MKETNKNFILGFLFLTLLSASCSTDDDGSNNNDNGQQIIEIVSIVEAGTWRITSFIDSGDNETSDFNGYDFTFQLNGTLSASNGSNTVAGTWSVTDSGSNDDSSDDIDFNIFFDVPDTNPFEDLNDDWDIVMYSENKIDLIDISGGNGGTDTLTFEKN